jgi:hypothetical protein
MCTGYQHPPEVEPYRLATIEERKAKRLKKKQKHDALIAGSQQEGEAMNPFQGQG